MIVSFTLAFLSKVLNSRVGSHFHLSANQDNLKVADFCLKETITLRMTDSVNAIVRPIIIRISASAFQTSPSAETVHGGGWDTRTYLQRPHCPTEPIPSGHAERRVQDMAQESRLR